MAISKKIYQSISQGSFIRRMFEKGAELKAKYGAENVFDFSLGNPDLEPPAEFKKNLLNYINDNKKNRHSYMPNAGYGDVRETVAKYVSKQQNSFIGQEGVVMTCGAGGALNIVLKTILNPEDEVLAPAPCFMEYKFYAENHNGVFKTVKCLDNFDIDIDAFEKTITEKTAAVIINSPNNPSGHIYCKNILTKFCSMLKKKSKEVGREIYLISDEPYKKLVYDNEEVPSLFDKYDNTVIVTSFSKDLSIPGERIGYVAVNQKADDFKNLMAGIILCNRIMGFVNAPGMMQNLVKNILDVKVDVSIYKKRRDIFVAGLKKIGYEFSVPKGTFYLFVKAPNGDDIKFIDILTKENILAVPGSGFSYPGYFRLAFCVSEETIQNSLKGFEKAFNLV